MKNALTNFGDMEDAIYQKPVELFLDYDGTLAAIASSPEKARMTKRTIDTLKKLSTMPWCSVSIISGRSLDSITKIFRGIRVNLAGNHGLEYKMAGGKRKVLLPELAIKKIRCVYKKVIEEIPKIKGVLAEDKGISVSLHYRLARDPNAAKQLRKFVAGKITGKNADKYIAVRGGKKIIEIRPVSKWDKGSILEHIHKRLGQKWKCAVIFFIGDDETDRDAFKAAGRFSVFVGKKNPRKAKYCLNSVSDVSKFLNCIIAAKSLKGTVNGCKY